MNHDQDGNGVVSRGERARWVERYRASGLGLKRFATEHGLKPGRLYHCVYTPGPASAAERGAPVFQELRLTGSVTSAAASSLAVAVHAQATRVARSRRASAS